MSAVDCQPGDWVWWRTPSNVSMEQHGVPPNSTVRVQIARDLRDGPDATGAYETDIPGYGWVSICEEEILKNE